MSCTAAVSREIPAAKVSCKKFTLLNSLLSAILLLYFLLKEKLNFFPSLAIIYSMKQQT